MSASIEFTAEQAAILTEFADNVAAGRRVIRLCGYVGALCGGIVAFIYYVVQIAKGVHGGTH